MGEEVDTWKRHKLEYITRIATVFYTISFLLIFKNTMHQATLNISNNGMLMCPSSAFVNVLIMHMIDRAKSYL